MSIHDVVDVRLPSPRLAPLRRGHPWLYGHPDLHFPELSTGQSVHLIDERDDTTVAYGLYDPGAAIVFRAYDRKAPVSAEYFQRRLVQCFDKRRPLRKVTDAIRILHGENDGIPAVVLDQYGDYAVLKLYSTALLPWVDTISDVLREMDVFKGVYLRYSRALKTSERVLFGEVPEQVVITEKGMRFNVDVRHGQKTGFFIDQRDGRQLARSHAHGTVLNCFAYTGGFSVASLLGDADKVISVDSSAVAVAACDEHVQMNAPGLVDRHESVVGDVWDYLRCGNSRFDMIILDPPTLTGDKTSMERAQKSYRDLHAVALSRLRKGGLLFTCSCSSRIPDAMFSSLVQETAVGSGHVLCQLESLVQPLDHPTRNKFPEGRYLKVMLYGSR